MSDYRSDEDPQSPKTLVSSQFRTQILPNPQVDKQIESAKPNQILPLNSSQGDGGHLENDQTMVFSKDFSTELAKAIEDEKNKSGSQ